MSLASLFVSRFFRFFAGLRSGATFVAALSSAGFLAQFADAPPIFVALVASLVAAGMAYLLAAQEPFDSDYSTIDQLSTHLADVLAVTMGLWAMAAIIPAIDRFVCEPAVPWRFSIAIFGAFGMSWLSGAMRIRVPHARTGLAIHAAFFWIAPFYGFFHAPWFLAQTIILPCEGRSLPQAAIVALGMAVATVAGRRAAKWMFGWL
jgi:hypothetical protein